MMKTKNRIFFYLGLVFFYFLIFLSPSKIIYFSAYFVSTFFFYLFCKNIRVSLLYSLVLSLFSEIGLAGSLFIMEPKELNMGSGWWVSPMTILIILLLPLSIRKKNENIKQPDYFVIIFYTISAFSLLIFPYTNSLLGFLTLTEVILVYYILRSQMNNNNLKNIIFIIISMLFFQSILGSFQINLKKTVGSISESMSVDRPYGITTAEEENLFRISGTFGHPNLFAAFLLVSIPFINTLTKAKSFIKIILYFLSFIILFFTFTRVAWLIGIIYLFIYFFALRNINIKLACYRIFILMFIILLFIISPYLQARITSFSPAFDEFGSMGVRFKLFSESMNLINQYPLLGVGINRSLEIYASFPVTNLFENVPKSGFYRIHNTALEIGTEMGLLGLLSLIRFMIFVLWSFLKDKNNLKKKAAVVSLLGLIAISMFNPFFHSSIFRYFFLLSAIIMV